MNVSVIVSSYGNRGLLEKTLDALERQMEGRSGHEIIVVDHANGRKCGAAIKNEGIRKARHEICLFMNEGVLLSPGFIGQLVRRHEQNARSIYLGRVHGLYQPENHPVGPILRKVYDSGKPDDCFRHPLISAFGDGRQKHFGILSELSSPWFLMHDALFSVERKVLEETGPFDERFEGRGVDALELGFRLWKAGCRFRVSDKLSGILFHDRQRPRPSRSDAIWFVSKHKTLDVELCSIPTNHSPFSLKRHFAVGVSSLPEDYEGIERLFDPLPEGRRLVVGCLSYRLPDRLQAADCLVLDRSRFPGADEPGQLNEMIGFFTWFGDSEFNHVLVTDVWRIIPQSLFHVFLREMARIGNHLYFIRTKGWEMPELIMPVYRELDEIHFLQCRYVDSDDQFDVMNVKLEG